MLLGSGFRSLLAITYLKVTFVVAFAFNNLEVTVKFMPELIFNFSGDQTNQLAAEQFPLECSWVSYALFIRVEKPQKIVVGRFGTFAFPAGDYVYYGSARKNILARLNRHLRREKKLRWHIDYLLAAERVGIVKIVVSTMPECDLVKVGGGTVVVPGFGASDCRAGCGSHLRRL